MAMNEPIVPSRPPPKPALWRRATRSSDGRPSDGAAAEPRPAGDQPRASAANVTRRNSDRATLYWRPAPRPTAPAAALPISGRGCRSRSPERLMRLFDSHSRQQQELPPPPGPLGMYFCGPTVYQRIHIGNARPFILGMWLKRWAEASGYQTRLVVNVTDINDKIYDAARALGIGSAELAERATRWYMEDTTALGLGRPDVEPLASETVPEIVALIAELIARGLAYEASGDVYFRVARFPDYGRLSGARIDEMVAQEPAALKEDPRDFALWKASKPDEDTSWESPWGRGRPGWHIECSAMAERQLGAEFQVHGGGLDLRFPHHENEIAQSRGAGRAFARLWAHNGMVVMGAEK